MTDFNNSMNEFFAMEKVLKWDIKKVTRTLLRKPANGSTNGKRWTWK